jgi:hypothetical protein
MTETQPGRFEAATVLATEGVYLVRVMASGLTFSGVSFTREQTLTAAVFVGGDQPLPTTPPKQPSPLCCIIESLTETESVIRFLDQHGLNAAEIRKATAAAVQTGGPSRTRSRTRHCRPISVLA